MPRHNLRWSDFPNSQEHSGGMISGFTTWWHTSSISLHLWCHGVKDSISSRNQSPLDSLHEIRAVGLHFLEAWAPRYHSASREETTQVLTEVSLVKAYEVK